MVIRAFHHRQHYILAQNMKIGYLVLVLNANRNAVIL